MDREKEKEIQARILSWLEAAGHLHWKMHVAGMRFSGKGRGRNPLTGHPDIAGVLKSGRYFAIEVKQPGAKLKPHQSEWRRDLEANGVLYIVATCVDDVARALYDAMKSAS